IGIAEQPAAGDDADVAEAVSMRHLIGRALIVPLGEKQRDAHRDAELRIHLVGSGDIEDVNAVVAFGALFGAIKLLLCADEVAVRVLITITDRELEAARAEPRLSRWVSFSSGN